MRRLNVGEVKKTIKKALIEANTSLPADVLRALNDGLEKEHSPLGRRHLQLILENAQIASCQGMALCQDTGLVVVEVELGQDLLLEEGELTEAINQGVREAYQEAFFRKSVVSDPFQRINTGDNTPAIIHFTLVAGEGLRLTVMPKGAGSENMGQLAMLKPAQGLEGVKDFVIKVVSEAGAKPCPPVIVGVGVGGLSAGGVGSGSEELPSGEGKERCPTEA